MFTLSASTHIRHSRLQGTMFSISVSVVIFFLTQVVALAASGQIAMPPASDKPVIKWQSLMFKTYKGDSIPYQFGMLRVPENRLRAGTRFLELAVLKLSRKVGAGPFKDSAQASSGPILFLSGGPGQSGIDYIKEEYFQKFIFQLQEHNDIILLDQRGTGRSKPSLGYPIVPGDNRNIFASPQRMIQMTDDAATAGYAAFKKSSIDISGYNTVQSADDLYDLKSALGVDKLSLLAISYGTHLAIATAKKHPEIISKMINIGTSGLNHMHHLPSTYDSQLKRVSDLAAGDSAILRQVPDMIDLLKRVLKKLEVHPVPLRIKDFRQQKMITVPVGKFGLQFILRLDAGDSYDFVYFPAMLYGIDQGDFRLLQQYAERRYNQFNGASGSGIFAMRQASGASPARYQQIKQEGKTALLGNSMNTPDIYAGWKNVDLGDDYREAFNCNIPTLFISGTLDSNTPIKNVEEIIKDFSKAAHVIVENAGHEDMLPNEDVHAAMVKFFTSDEVGVRTITLPIPKFVPVY